MHKLALLLTHKACLQHFPLLKYLFINRLKVKQRRYEKNNFTPMPQYLGGNCHVI
jgi:hypothetical protein